MVRKRYSDELRRQVVKAVEQGSAVADVIKRFGIAEATYYRWRERYGDAPPERDQRLRGLEEENRRLRALVAKLVLRVQELEEQQEVRR
ncbi:MULTISPECIES: transposase [Rhodospirillales]|uniref:Transposase, putative n=2 Tax=Rhodospirillales TaxID=204441 RepID=B6INW6_RHOCS|nr:transposase [Rhodospirillum centenum]ACI99386.1 transposase, putative [Rhodospirillum centenum SW]